MKIDRSGAVFIASSVVHNSTLREEREAGGVSGIWNKVCIATTKDKQLAVHYRGNGNFENIDFAATGISKNKLKALRKADNDGGSILPPVAQTARAILQAANMADRHYMTDRDLVRLARLTASGNYRLAERIYAQAELEENQADTPRLTTHLLILAQQDAWRTGILMDGLEDPMISVQASEAIAQFALKDLQGAISLTAKASLPDANQVQAAQAALDLGKIFDRYPEAARSLVEAYPGYIDELSQLADFAVQVAEGLQLDQDSIDFIFDLAVNLPCAACRLSQLLLDHDEPPAAQDFLQTVDFLIRNEVATTTINRLAEVGAHNVGVGQSLATLIEMERQNPGLDPGLVTRFARQVRQDVVAGGVITANPGVLDDNQNNRELINSFRNLLVREFGEDIAGNIFAAQLEMLQMDNVPLSLDLMQAAITAARELQDAAATLVGMMDDDGNTAAYAREQAALKAFNQAAQSGGFPDAERAELYREEMLDMLAETALGTYRVDGTGDNSLLTKLAGRMAEKEFDGKILEMLATDMRTLGKGKFSYGETISNAVDGGADALVHLKTVTYPTLGHLLQTGSQNGIAFLNHVLDHLHADVVRHGNPVGTRFFGGDDLTHGLTDLTITSSDPHKGGERVVILNFGPANLEGQDRLLVYKPRDVRIDAMQTGSRAIHGETQSLADIVNHLLGDDAVPTYSFLEGPGGPEEYGYVEYVPHGRMEDFQMTPPQAETFYREYGRQTAMFMLMGTRDLHQTNIFVSNRRPYFTDLELAVDPQCLEFITAPPLDGDLCDVNQAGPRSRVLAKAMQLDGGLFNRGESIRIPKATVDVATDRLVETMGNRSEIAWESFVWIDGEHQEQPLDIDNAMEPTEEGFGSAQQFGAAAFELGFHEVILALAQEEAQEDITGYITSLAGLHLRYHPLATPLQLRPRQDLVADHLHDDDQARQQFLEGRLEASLNQMAAGGQTRAARLNGVPDSDNLVATRIRDAMVSDLSTGDVAYFTRVLGGDHRELLHHHSVDGVIPIPVNLEGPSNDFFADNGLETLQAIFTRLHTNPDRFREYLLALGSGFAELCRTTPGAGFASEEVREALH